MSAGHWIVIGWAAIAFSSSHQSTQVPTSDALVEHVVRPEVADPAADRWLEDQYAYYDRKAARASSLVVHLVGANNKPIAGRPMMRELASMGFHVVAPMYANDYPIRDLCEKPDVEPDDDCHRKMRLEAIEGRDHSAHLEVRRANSIEERIGRLLAHLRRSFPDEGWEAFLDGQQPRWSAIVISGHSHGASSAALIGKVRRVDRVVMLSGPFDNRAGAPARWTTLAPATPNDRFYGLSHLQEEQHQGHLANWQAMGLTALGKLASVDDESPPYHGSHQLVTDLAGVNPHGITAAGSASPVLPDGRYRLAPAWRYLYGR